MGAHAHHRQREAPLLLQRNLVDSFAIDLLKIGTRMAQISCCIILHQNRSKCLLNITSDLIFCVTKMLSRSRKEANGEENDGVGGNFTSEKRARYVTLERYPTYVTRCASYMYVIHVGSLPPPLLSCSIRAWPASPT